MERANPNKIEWKGRLVSIQPRIRLTRSFDQRSHTYLGYIVLVDGTIGDEAGSFTVALGKSAHAKHGFRVGDTVRGLGERVADSRLETADLYKASRLKREAHAPGLPPAPPPWHGAPPALEVYRDRGHRRLAAQTYERTCKSCIWGSRMPVEMIIDHWNPHQRRFRTETFCYGPLSCRLYRAGPTRKVPGRRGMSFEEEDWVDDEATSHRDPDE